MALAGDAVLAAQAMGYRALHLRNQGKFAEAGALVNITRTKNGLPAITAFDATTPVPGGARGCVPKMPQGSTVTCGNLWEALKYEKRIETAYTLAAL